MWFVLAGGTVAAIVACLLLVLLDPGSAVRLRARRHERAALSRRKRASSGPFG